MKFRFVYILLLSLTFTSCINSFFTKRNVQMGKDAFYKNDKKTAFSYFDKAARISKRRGEAYYFRGVIYEEQNRPELALNDYIHSFKYSENKALSGLAVGRMLVEKGKFEAGLPYLESAIKFDSTDVNIGYYLMRTLINLGKSDEAIILFEKYADAEKDASMNYAKALAADSLGIPDYAIVFYRNAIELNASIPELYADFAQLLFKTGNTEAALEVSTLGIELHNNVNCYKVRLQIFIYQYQWHKAISEATTLYNITKKLEYIERRARIYQFLGLLNNANKDYTFILSTEPNNSNALFHRAIVNQRLQNDYMVLYDLNLLLNIDEKLVPEWQINRAREIMLLTGQEIPPSTISITKPKPLNNKYLGYSSKNDSIEINGTVVENAKISKLTINGIEIQTKTSEKRVRLFKHTLPYPTNDTIKVELYDVYENHIEQTYELIPTEKNNPELILFEPTPDSTNKAQTLALDRFFRIKFLTADESYISHVSINNTLFDNPTNSRTFMVDTLVPIPSNNKLTISAFDVFGNKTIKSMDLKVQRDTKVMATKVRKDMLFVIINGTLNQNADSTFMPQLSELLSNASNVEILVIDKNEKRSLERELLFNLPKKIKQGEYRDLVMWFNGDGIEEKESSYWYPAVYDSMDKQTWFNISFLSSFTETINPKGSVIYIANSIFLPERLTGKQVNQNQPQALFFKHTVNKNDTVSAIKYIEKRVLETGRVDWIQLITDLSELSPEQFKYGWIEGYYKKHNLPAIMFWGKNSK
ncbi:MAG: tetratricopeptide repeat protein [Salinivirgaceae bacterium]|nr:tetratricopeptide repeat protein [Salinivirgaceae bacterium]MDY0279431.1 tetratricopeptide repeat protein [Salinivirgaceae bacterium]